MFNQINKAIRLACLHSELLTIRVIQNTEGQQLGNQIP